MLTSARASIPIQKNKDNNNNSDVTPTLSRWGELPCCRLAAWWQPPICVDSIPPPITPVTPEMVVQQLAKKMSCRAGRCKTFLVGFTIESLFMFLVAFFQNDISHFQTPFSVVRVQSERTPKTCCRSRLVCLFVCFCFLFFFGGGEGNSLVLTNAAQECCL
jgi:hypothetical protein